jgi:hypothetical protein
MTIPPSTGPSSRRGGLDLIVAQLSQDLEQLRAEQSANTGMLGEASGLIAQIMPRLGEVETGLGDTQDRFKQLVDAVATLTRPDQGVTAVHWPSLTADAASDQWQLLTDWVEEILEGWYQLTRGQLPDCWALHRPMVVELSWLRSGYLAAYSPKAVPHLAAEWHTRWRRDALANIAAALDSHWCRPGEHLVEKGISEKRANERRDAQREARQRAAGVSGKPRHQWTADETRRHNDTDPYKDDPLARRYAWHPDEEPTRRGYQEPFLRRAIEQDLAWRAARDAQQTRPKPSPVPRTL